MNVGFNGWLFAFVAGRLAPEDAAIHHDSVARNS